MELAFTNSIFHGFSGQLVTSSLDKKLFFWDTNTRSVNPHNTLMLESAVAALSVCDMYILVAVERDVYRYDMRNLTGPIKANDSPLKHHIRCLHASEQWKGAYISLQSVQSRILKRAYVLSLIPPVYFKIFPRRLPVDLYTIEILKGMYECCYLVI